jgi:DNA-binding beta-propeller fold protein YncE
MTININAASSALRLDKKSVKYNFYQEVEYASISNFTSSLDGTEFYAIYGAYTGKNSLYVIDAATGKTTKKIKLPDANVNSNTYGPFDMIMSPNGKMLYIVASTEIIKIDVVSKEISAVVSTGKKSSDRSIDITGDGLKVVAADYADYGMNNETYIHVVDTQKNILSDAIPKGGDSGGFYRSGFANLVVNKLSNMVYLIDDHTDSIAILDLNSKVLQLNAIPLSSRALMWSIAIDSARGLLYVVEPDKSRLDVIDVNSKKMLDQINIGESGSQEVSLSPDGNRAYIQSDTLSKVIVVDTRSRRIIKTIEVPYRLNEMQISSNGKQLYMISSRHIFGESWSEVNIYDAETGEEIKSFPVERI